jgi:hypothetical protein
MLQDRQCACGALFKRIRATIDAGESNNYNYYFPKVFKVVNIIHRLAAFRNEDTIIVLIFIRPLDLQDT